MGRQTLKLLDRLFPKKIRDKDVQKFWKEFEERADLYLTILKEDEEDSEDREWMDVLIKKCLGRVCVDADAPFGFGFEAGRDPVRFVFRHCGDEFLKKVGEKLVEFYPKTLAGKIDFIVAE